MFYFLQHKCSNFRNQRKIRALWLSGGLALVNASVAARVWQPPSSNLSRDLIKSALRCFLPFKLVMYILLLKDKMLFLQRSTLRVQVRVGVYSMHAAVSCFHLEFSRWQNQVSQNLDEPLTLLLKWECLRAQTKNNRILKKKTPIIKEHIKSM